MRPGALPLSQLIMLDLFLPPVVSGIWWVMSRGWAASIQGGTTSERTKQRQSTEFWAVLIMTYLLAFGFTVYAWLT